MSNFEQTRREFLRMAGKTMLGAAAVTAVPAIVHADEAVEAPAFPWTWQPLDKAEVQARVFANFSTHGGCCAGVASGILELLAEKYGYPYNQINGRMFAHGGGGYGRKNLCGALGGAFAVMGLFLTGGDMNAARNQIYSWYESTALPVFHPEGLAHKYTSVAGSELCRDSVRGWMNASGMDFDKDFGHPDRLYRCSCLSADVAGQVVDILNAKFGYAAPVEEAPVDAPALADNEYIGVANGFGGQIKVKVTMDGDKIAKIEVLEHAETAGIYDKAYPAVTDAIIAAQSTSVDTVSGATFSSQGLIDAVNDALSKIKK